jgi:hypothetical protein
MVQKNYFKVFYKNVSIILLLKVNIKVKMSLCFYFNEYHAIKAYWGSGCITRILLTSALRWR